jgi:hypothetical protein
MVWVIMGLYINTRFILYMVQDLQDDVTAVHGGTLHEIALVV